MHALRQREPPAVAPSNGPSHCESSSPGTPDCGARALKWGEMRASMHRLGEAHRERCIQPPHALQSWERGSSRLPFLQEQDWTQGGESQIHQIGAIPPALEQSVGRPPSGCQSPLGVSLFLQGRALGLSPPASYCELCTASPTDRDAWERRVQVNAPHRVFAGTSRQRDQNSQFSSQGKPSTGP